ncbi:hypothetical protein U9M48_001476 [Paspalum notatum var. saurae]|uniref:Major facilitator superfamily (MFS) profile domain-containing protein n=1 Tax=Paspalum notatum var. saurae TaxID=547442 RepID=A0AAQ3PJI8_PASNO
MGTTEQQHHGGATDVITAPLLPSSEAPPRRNMFAFVCATLASMTTILMGYNLALMSGAELFMREDLGLTDEQVEVLSGSMNLFMLVSILAAGWAADAIGRRATIMVANAFLMADAGAMSLGGGYASLLSARFVTSVGVGLSVVVAPVYAAEVAPASSRGLLSSLVDFFITGGILLSYVSNYALAGLPLRLGWRVMFALGMPPPPLLAAGVLAMPESPRPSPPRPRIPDDSSKKPSKEDGGSSKQIMTERVVKEVNMAVLYPEFTRSNYNEWSLVMQGNLEAQGLWEAMQGDPVDRREDRTTLGALLRAVPSEMRSILAVKKTAKEAWDAVVTMRLGVDRVKAANAQKLMREFENITFKDGEAVDEFAMRIQALAANIRTLGESLEDVRVVKKMLRVVPARYNQIAASIETLLDLNTISVEELVGRLRAFEDQVDGGDGGETQDRSGRLMMAEEDWLAKWRHKLKVEGAPSGEKAGSSSSTKPKNNARADGRDTGGKLTSEGTPRRKGRCRNCGIYSHWAKECRKPKKERREERRDEAHVAKAEVEQPALLLARACDVVRTPSQSVFLNMERVHPEDYDNDTWYLDTGATNHMTGCRSALTSLDESVKGAVRFGDGSTVDICGLGVLTVATQNKEHRALTDVYYIPSLKSNIISLGQLEEGRCEITIGHGVLRVYDRQGTLMARAARRNRLYTLSLKLCAPVCLLSKIDEEAWRWHARFGHLNFRSLHDLGAKKMVDGIPLIKHGEQFCDGCALGKQHRAPFPHASAYRAQKGLELFHGDLCGQIEPSTPGGKRYFLLIVDDCTRFMWIELLATKDEAFKYLKVIKATAENELGGKLKAFRSDRGGEFNSIAIGEFCGEHGIKHYTTAPYTPQQNGVVERRNQTVVEMAQCLLKSMDVPAAFWGEAVKTAVYILNRSPTKSLDGKTPFEAWYKRKPSVQHLRTFGCVAFVKIVGPGVNKLADRSVPGVFLRYEPGTKGYHVYDPVGRKLMVSRDVLFDEKRAWDWTKFGNDKLCTSKTLLSTTQSQKSSRQETHGRQPRRWQCHRHQELHSPASGQATPNSPLNVPPSPSTIPGVQWATPPSEGAADSDGVALRYRTIPNLLDNTEEVTNFEYSGLCLLAAEEPHSVEQALSEKCWRQAMEIEMQAIQDNGTWTPVGLPAGHKAIGLKWVFKVKKDPAGNIIKHKARLVVKGYAQRQGVDFDEVFAPVARMETVRLLIALAAHGGWEIHHMDVKSAFLNGDLAEDVYVQQPPGFLVGDNENKVLKLRKALYGLHQAPRAWYARLDAELISLGFKRSKLEYAVYRRGESGTPLLVGVYVDDLIICGPSKESIAKFKQEMMQRFSMTDLGPLSYYLGIEVRQGDGEITLSQSAYAAKILENAGMTDCNACKTPFEERQKLSKKDCGDAVDATMFKSIIGSLRYIVNTRPDLAYSVGVASRYMEAPGTQHWAAVKQILRYLKGTQSYGLKYRRGTAAEPSLVGFSDSDHAGDLDDRKSTTGVAYFLGPSLVSWASQKQKTVALSSCEAEFVAAASAACQGVWLSRLLGELLGKEPAPVDLLVDNQSAIALSKNPVHHDRSKHIDTKFHFIRECVDDGKVKIDHVGTREQLANILTKPLGRVKFVEFRQMPEFLDPAPTCSCDAPTRPPRLTPGSRRSGTPSRRRWAAPAASGGALRPAVVADGAPDPHQRPRALRLPAGLRHDAIVLYTPLVFKQAGISSNATVAVGAVKTLSIFVATFLSDRLGRRPLLLARAAGIAVTLTALGITLCVAGETTTAAAACVASVMAFVAAFSIGLGPIAPTHSAEILPLRLRAQGMSLGIATNRVTCSVVSMTFISLSNTITMAGCFFLYASTAVAAFVFVCLRLPETKGRSLEDIGVLFVK